MEDRTSSWISSEWEVELTGHVTLQQCLSGSLVDQYTNNGQYKCNYNSVWVMKLQPTSFMGLKKWTC